jgi:multisubunit Na+/H+ antiporter MnhF subunit
MIRIQTQERCSKRKYWGGGGVKANDMLRAIYIVRSEPEHLVVSACTTSLLSAFCNVFRVVSGKNIRDNIFIIKLFLYNFLCILCFDCIYYDTDLRDALLYIVIS